MNLAKNKDAENFPRPLLLTMFAIFLVMLGLNMLYPAMSDDYLFRFVWNSETGSMYSLPLEAQAKRIETFDEILSSLKSMYLYWGGRMVTWGLVYVFANLPDLVFDVCNSAMFLLFLTLATMIGTGTFSIKNLSARWMGAAFLLLWGTAAMFANVYLWLCGSCVYLWAGTAQLAFLFFYVRLFWQKHDEAEPPVPVMFCLGVLSGWSNENTAAVVIGLAVLFYLRFRRQKNAAPWQLWGVIGAVLGYGALMLAPGNFVKLTMTASSVEAIKILAYQRENALMAIAFCLPMLLVFLRLPHLKRDEAGQKTRVMATWFLLAGLINAAVMLPLPSFPLRSLTGTVYFWLIGALAVLKIDNTIFKQGIMYAAVKIYFVLSVLTLATFAYTMAAYLLPQDLARDEMARQNVGQDLILPPYHGSNALMNLAVAKGYRVDIGTIAQNKNMWANVMYAKYWHLKSVVREKNFVAE